MALLGFMGLIVAVIIVSALKEAKTLEKADERKREQEKERQREEQQKRQQEETTRRKIGSTAGTKRANPKR